jgi:mannose-6-phosphate isomerase-like protein (cupin superfamily)
VTVARGNVTEASAGNRGWFIGHFMPGEDNPLHSRAVELKWFTHPEGDVRSEWSPEIPVRTLNILIRGRFVIVLPDQEVALEREGDFVLFGPGVAHSYRSLEESLVLTVRWPSRPPEPPRSS